ncbi:hypothetical protein NEOLEDRAFT_1133063 [Neolentinus lepideus HHB14362 ss-1]|uniref:DUF6534 domain-containing protein n=1 Tax=Neolentinus lepideus HHB14362 ss-1 TaxID=1314782 RepID=A0A165T1B8_9AGAM|nr:hypothetical protein NEOLEDRAFT_1133063 [Neolentinus lepideus HHB14362 ss-1]
MSSHLHLHHFDLNGTLGAVFIGHAVASFFSGVTTAQTHLYFYRSCSDSRSFKGLIFFLWVLDILHLAFTTHVIYYYTIRNYSNVIATVTPVWSVTALITVMAVSDFAIRSIFIVRIWRMRSGNWPIVLVIVLTSLAAWGAGTAYGVRILRVRDYRSVANLGWVLYMCLSSIMISDILIAASFCLYLYRNRTGFPRTDSLLSMLMKYSINTSVLTCICTVLILVTYATMQNLVYLGIFIFLSKLYLNALLASLNSRHTAIQRPSHTCSPGSSRDYGSRHKKSFSAGTSASVAHNVARPRADGSTRTFHEFPPTPSELTKSYRLQ